MKKQSNYNQMIVHMWLFTDLTVFHNLYQKINLIFQYINIRIIILKYSYVFKHFVSFDIVHLYSLRHKDIVSVLWGVCECEGCGGGGGGGVKHIL